MKVEAAQTALDVLREILEEQADKPTSIRMYFAGAACSGPSFGLALDDKKPSDVACMVEELEFVMDAQEYESFLSSIQNTALEQATNLTAKGEPVLKITIKHFDTDRIDTISFYETDGNILVVTGDIVRGMIGTSSFETLIESMPI